MLNLILIRHGKSSWVHPDTEDFDRPLNDRGRNDLEEMAGLMSDAFPAPDYILSSSAVRAKQTIEGLSGLWKFNKVNIDTVDDLYLAEPDEILQILHTSGQGKTVYICAHNPGISDFASYMIGKHLDYFPTLGSAWLVFDKPDDVDDYGWKHIDWKEGRLEAFIRPENKRDSL